MIQYTDQHDYETKSTNSDKQQTSHKWTKNNSEDRMSRDHDKDKLRYRECWRFLQFFGLFFVYYTESLAAFVGLKAHVEIKIRYK